MTLLKRKKAKLTDENAVISMRNAAKSAPPEKGKNKKTPKPKKEKNVIVPKRKVKKSAPVLVGIDIGSEEVKVAVGQYKRGKVYVNKICKTKLPDGSFTDGKVDRTFEVGLAIKNLLKENRIGTKKIACTIDSSQILRRSIYIPAVHEKDIPKILDYEAEQYLPVDLSSYLLQYDILEKQDNPGFIHLEVFAMPTSLAAKLQTTVRTGDLTPWSLDVNSHSLEKLLCLEGKYRKELKELNIVFIDMGRSRFTLSYFSGGRCQATKMLDCGGNMLNDVFLTNLEFSEKSVEHLKIKNLTNIGMQELAQNYYQLKKQDEVKEKEDVILVKLMQVFEKWTAEIETMLRYFEAGAGSGKIDQIYVYGGSSQIKDLEVYMTDFLKIPTVTLQKMECINIPQKYGEGTLTTYLNAFCALVRF